MSSVSFYTLQLSENNILFVTKHAKTGIKPCIAFNFLVTACAVAAIAFCYRSFGTSLSAIKQVCLKPPFIVSSTLALFTLIIGAKYCKLLSDVSHLENDLLSLKRKNTDVVKLSSEEKNHLLKHLQNLLYCTERSLKSLKAVPYVGVQTPEFKELSDIQKLIQNDLVRIRSLSIRDCLKKTATRILLSFDGV